MKEVARNQAAGPKGAHALKLLRVRPADIKRTGLHLRIENDGRSVWGRKLIGTGKLLTSGLCKSIPMHDEKGEVFLKFYLDDPPAP